MAYLAPIPKEQITIRDPEFSQDRSLMRVTHEDRISLREKAAGIAKSGLYKDVNTPEKALCIMLMGRSLGVNELTALQGIYIINGRPWISADLIFALVRAKGVCKNMEAETSLKGAMCSMTRKDDGFKFTARFGPEEAKLAKLETKETYQKYPDQMYLHRAVRRCCTMVCPEILMGIGVDEDGYSTNQEMNGPEGEIIAQELAEGEEQLRQERVAFYAQTRQRDSDWKPFEGNKAVSQHVGPVDTAPAIDTDHPTENSAACLSGVNLNSAMDLYGEIRENGGNGEKFADWLKAEFNASSIESVAETDGARLVEALKKHLANMRTKEAKKPAAKAKEALFE